MKPRQSPAPEPRNPIKALLLSRKFLLLLFDTFASTIAYFGFAVVIEVIAIWQPVVVALILAIAWEDAAQKGSAPSQINTTEINE